MYSLCSLCVGFLVCDVEKSTKSLIWREQQCPRRYGFVLLRRGGTVIERRMKREGYRVKTMDGKVEVERRGNV